MDAWRPRVTEVAYAAGMVESYFVKLNDPGGRWAAWLKYTFLVRQGGATPSGACWCILFDRAARPEERVVAFKERFEADHQAGWEKDGGILLGSNVLSPGLVSGSLAGGRAVWRFSFLGGDEPFVLLPRPFYSPMAPTTKLTTPVPVAAATGRLSVAGRDFVFDGAPVTVGHNWGHRHARSYVWAQAAGADADGDFFVEAAALPAEPGTDGAEVHPRLTVARVRSRGEEIDFVLPVGLALNQSRVRLGRFDFDVRNPGWHLTGEVTFEPEWVAGLRYRQPDGTLHACLNSMLASGRFRLARRGLWGKARDVRDVVVPGTAALEHLLPRLDTPFGLLV